MKLSYGQTSTRTKGAMLGCNDEGRDPARAAAIPTNRREHDLQGSRRGKDLNEYAPELEAPVLKDMGRLNAKSWHCAVGTDLIREHLVLPNQVGWDLRPHSQAALIFLSWTQKSTVRRCFRPVRLFRRFLQTFHAHH